MSTILVYSLPYTRMPVNVLLYYPTTCGSPHLRPNHILHNSMINMVIATLRTVLKSHWSKSSKRSVKRYIAYIKNLSRANHLSLTRSGTFQSLFFFSRKVAFLREFQLLLYIPHIIMTMASIFHAVMRENI